MSGDDSDVGRRRWSPEGFRKVTLILLRPTSLTCSDSPLRFCIDHPGTETNWLFFAMVDNSRRDRSQARIRKTSEICAQCRNRKVSKDFPAKLDVRLSAAPIGPVRWRPSRMLQLQKTSVRVLSGRLAHRQGRSTRATRKTAGLESVHTLPRSQVEVFRRISSMLSVRSARRRMPISQLCDAD